MIGRILAAALLIAQWGCTAVEPSYARDDGQWAGQPADVRAWFATVTQPGLRSSCCGEGDAFEVTLDGNEPNGDIRAIIVNGKSVYPDGKVVFVPPERLQTKYGNPLGITILFININSGEPLCLIPFGGV